jgi:hypothetical protein
MPFRIRNGTVAVIHEPVLRNKNGEIAHLIVLRRLSRKGSVEKQHNKNQNHE